MKELVEVIAKALVDNPDEVVVTEKKKAETLKLNFMLHLLIWVRLLENRVVLQKQCVLLLKLPLLEIKQRWMLI